MGDFFNFKTEKRRTFPRHFVQRVIAEVRFSPYQCEWKKVSSKIEQVLKAEGIQTIRPAYAGNFLFKQEGNKVEEASFLSQTIGLLGEDIETGISIEFQTDKLIFVQQKYKSFENFWELFEKYVPKICDALGIESIQRLGIRKISGLEVQLSDGENYAAQGFSNDFFTPVRTKAFKLETLAQGYNSYVLEKDNRTIIVRTQFDRRKGSNKYAISVDFDYIVSFKPAQKLKGLQEVAAKVNEELFELFCWVISPDLKEALEKGNF